MQDARDKKNMGLIYDLLVAGGAPTALTALVAAAAVGYGAYRLTRAAVRQISDYLQNRERDLEAQLEKVREAQSALGDAETEDDDKSARAGAHRIYR